jgi:hypothetical protein
MHFELRPGQPAREISLSRSPRLFFFLFQFGLKFLAFGNPLLPQRLSLFKITRDAGLGDFILQRKLASGNFRGVF